MLYLLFQRSLDEKGNLLWIDRFSPFKGAVGAAPNSLQNGSHLLLNDVLTDLFMIRFETGKVLFIEEMAERSMADIMQ